MSTQKNFINFHVLISHSPSCLNRDDQNMQKRAVFGGVERIRISSQSLKRAMRRPPENALNYWRDCGVLGDPSTRTRSIDKVTAFMIGKLNEEFKDDELTKHAVQMFVNSTKKQDNDDSSEEDDDPESEGTESKGTSVAPWAISEIREICRAIKTAKDKGLTEEENEKALAKVGKEVGKKGNKRKLTEKDCIDEAIMKKILEEIKNTGEVIKNAIGSAVDIALWGRMATSGLMTSIDGSLAIAHAITTHAAQADTDWFTAVDDLVQDAGEVGAGHLDTQEFSSGVFYRYASLNIAQLQKNIGGATRERALEIAKHVFHMLCTVVPSAKQQSFAAHNPSDFAIVSFADQPISMANAFEKPVEKAKAGGYYAPSVVELMKYWQCSNDFYGLHENAVFCSKDVIITATEGIENKKSLAEVETWIYNDGVNKKDKE
jgi:CRISPR system Cascade subunit CasC